MTLIDRRANEISKGLKVAQFHFRHALYSCDALSNSFASNDFS